LRLRFLIALAVAAFPAGYFIFGNSEGPVTVALAPQATTDVARGKTDLPPVGFLALSETETSSAKATGIPIESRAELQPAERLDLEPTQRGVEARPPQWLPERGRRRVAAGRNASILPEDQ
jgi:hypothetical protein